MNLLFRYLDWAYINLGDSLLLYFLNITIGSFVLGSVLYTVVAIIGAVL